MDEVQSTEPKRIKGQSDVFFVGGILAFYCLCSIALIGLVVWGLGQREETLSSFAISTADAMSTDHANATATAGELATQQSRYEYVEEFARNSGNWYVGKYNIAYGNISVSIRNGYYVWDFNNSIGLTHSTEFIKKKNIKDFDSYIDLKIAENPENGVVCSGFYFRKKSGGWDAGSYIFLVCNSGQFVVYYLDEAGWETIHFSEYHAAIKLDDWNRIAISARKDHFIFYINNVEVYEMTDDRLEAGGLGIFFEVEEKKPTVIWIDNFGFQPR